MVFLTGPTLSGKSTIARIIAKGFINKGAVDIFSTGQFYRDYSSTEEKMEDDKNIRSRDLSSTFEYKIRDKVYNLLLDEKAGEASVGMIDGFPRSVPQLEFLYECAPLRQIGIIFVVYDAEDIPVRHYQRYLTSVDPEYSRDRWKGAMESVRNMISICNDRGGIEYSILKTLSRLEE